MDGFVYNSEVEYYLPEFYDKFKEKFPLLAIVISGHYGKTNWDDFNDGMIVWFHQHFAQERAIARESCEAKKQNLDFLSIPVHSYYKCHRMNRRNKVNPAEAILDVIKDDFPVLVTFSEDTAPPVLSSSSTAVLITSVYNEIYLQGNCVTQGIISKEPVSCILSPHISVTPITGHNEKSPEEFKIYLKTLEEFAKNNTTFGHTLCDQSVKKFNMNEEGYKHLVRSDAIFPGVDTYSAPPTPSRTSCSSVENENVYEPVSPNTDNEIPPVPVRTSIRKKATSLPLPSGPQWVPIEPPQNPNKVSGSSSLGPRWMSSKQNEAHEAKANNDSTFCHNDGGHNTTPRLPPRPKVERWNSVPSDKSTSYVTQDLHDSNQTSDNSLTRDLSVEGVCSVLKKLKLRKHVESFRSNDVDGQLLLTFHEDLLQSEFEFTKIETVRLITYIKTGHIPK